MKKNTCLTAAFCAAFLGTSVARAASPDITFFLPESPSPGSTGQVFVDAEDSDGDLASISVWIQTPDGSVSDAQAAYGYYGNITLDVDLEPGTYYVNAEVRDAASHITLKSTSFTVGW
jgi:hypothetical protein